MARGVRIDRGRGRSHFRGRGCPTERVYSAPEARHGQSPGAETDSPIAHLAARFKAHPFWNQLAQGLCLESSIDATNNDEFS
jgi:hypothetical protein